MPHTVEFQLIAITVVTAIVLGLVREGYRLPALAMLLSLASMVTYTEVEAESLLWLDASVIICAAICLIKPTNVAKTIAALFLIRIIVFHLSSYDVYSVGIMWLVNAYIVLLQSLVLIGGAINGSRVGDRVRKRTHMESVNGRVIPDFNRMGR